MRRWKDGCSPWTTASCYVITKFPVAYSQFEVTCGREVFTGRLICMRRLWGIMLTKTQTDPRVPTKSLSTRPTKDLFNAQGSPAGHMRFTMTTPSTILQTRREISGHCGVLPLPRRRLFCREFESHSRPSYSPSPDVATQPSISQSRWRSPPRPSLSVMCAGPIAFGKSCGFMGQVREGASSSRNGPVYRRSVHVYVATCVHT